MEPTYTKRDLESHDAVGIVIQNEEGKFLCFFHNKFQFWTIPIGKAEEGQSPEDAAKREVEEECGIHVEHLKQWHRETYEYIRQGKHVIVPLFLYQILSYSGTLKNMEPEKHREMSYFTAEELQALDNTSDATKMLLRYLENSK